MREDDIPQNLLKELEANGLRKLTQLINKNHKIVEWLKDFLTVSIMPLKKKHQTK